MHKSLTPFDRMILQCWRDLYEMGNVGRAAYMAVQTRHRPRVQERQPAEPFRPRRPRALRAAGPRR